MKRRVGLLTVIIAATFALPASAQVRKRDHRKKDDQDAEVVKSRRGGGAKGVDPVRVTGFRPQSGPVGTLVQVDGEGFDRKTQLLLGGKRLRPKQLNRDAITFVMPDRWGNGQIVLRHPDMANDLIVGTFEVIADPVIQSFAPASGVGGTRIEVRGTGFRNGDQLLMNKRPVRIERLTEDRIIAAIPNDATTDFLIVARPNGPQTRSPQEFRVVQPAPIITGLTPASGPSGTRVRIDGDNFTPNDKVFYGRRPVKVVASSPTSLDFVVPANAGADEFITVRGVWGNATSAQRFQLERLPSIDRFTPLYGVVGQRVEIYGANFMARDIVTLNGQPVRILQLRPAQISVEIPRGASTGAFVVERGADRVAARDSFEVVYMPMVNGFSPSGGEEGAQVTITGSYFTADAEVFFGQQKLRVLRRSDSTLVVEIPRRATDQFFTVRTKGGEATSQTAFRVYVYSEITDVTPRAGTAGTRVSIRGKNLHRDDRFFLGATELPVEDRRRDEVLVVIPNGARSGRISWDSFGRRADSRFGFDVLEPPVLSNFGPLAGPPGTEVTINGANFSRDTRVLWGNDELKVVRRTLPNQLVALIPPRASGTNYLWVLDAGARVRSSQAFQIVMPPAISGFSPGSGPAGTEITIAGTDFTKNTTVRLGNTPLDIVRISPTSLVVRLPAGLAAGKDYLWVDQDGAANRSPSTFEVTGIAMIDSFRPERAKPGQRVELFGTNFTATTRILFERVECKVLRVDRSGRKLQIEVPPDASGSGYLFAEDHGQRSRSPNRLEIDSTGPPAEKVPSRRGRKRGR